MTTHAAAPALQIPRRGEPSTPTEALAAFIAAGRRETLIGELTRKWYTLGRSEVEDAVDHAIAEATRAMRATREQAIYDYLRTAAHRVLARRKERAGRISAPIAADVDFDRMIGETLSPEDALLAKEHRQVVLDLVSALDDRTLAVMRLKHVEGLERKHVAERLGISEKAVKKAIERGLRACRERYDAAVEGQLCAERHRAIAAYEAGSATPRDRRQAEQHLAHCAACGARHRALAATQRAAAALVPLPLLGLHLGFVGHALRAGRRLVGERLGFTDAGIGRGALMAGGTKLAVAAVSVAIAGGAAHGHAGHVGARPKPAAQDTTRTLGAEATSQTIRSATRDRAKRRVTPTNQRSHPPQPAPGRDAVSMHTAHPPSAQPRRSRTQPATTPRTEAARVPEARAPVAAERATAAPTPGEFPVL